MKLDTDVETSPLAQWSRLPASFFISLTMSQYESELAASIAAANTNAGV